MKHLKTLWIYLSLAVSILFVYFTPKLLSSGSGKYLLFSLIHKESGLTCETKELELCWFGPQKASKVHITGVNTEIFSAERVEIRGSLPRLLLYRRPKTLVLQGWSLTIDESKTLAKPSISHLDPGTFLSYLEHSDVLSEHGSITMKTIDGTTLSISGFYINKTSEHCLIKCQAAENAITGKIFIQSKLKPSVHISAELTTVPISFFKLFIASPTWDRILSAENFLNISASALHDEGKILMNAYLEGNQIAAKLQGHIFNSVFYIIEDSPSFIDLQPKIASTVCSELFQLPVKITTQNVKAHVSSAKIPLNITRWKRIEISLQALLPRISFQPKNPNLHIQLENVDIGIKRTDRFTHIRGSSTSIMGGASKSYVNGLLTVNHKRHTSHFRIQHSLLPHTYLRALFPKPFFINLPLEVPYYSLNLKGKYKKSQLHADLTLDNPLLKLNGLMQGSLQGIEFQGNATYYLSEKWKEKLSPHFSHVEAEFLGKFHISQKHFYFPKFSGKIIAGDNELFFHGKFGKPGEPIKPETTSTLVYGQLSSIPLNILSSKFSPLEIKKANFSFHTSGEKSQTKGSLQIMVEDPEHPSLPSGRLLIPDLLISVIDNSKDFSINNLNIQSSGEILDLPIDRLMQLQGKEAILSPYFGPTGNVTFSILYSAYAKDRLTLLSSFESEAVRGDLQLIMNDSLVLSPATHGSLQWEISPDRYTAFFKNASCMPSCLLHRPAVIRMEISKIACKEQQTGLTCLSLLSEGGFEGAITSSPLVFYDHITKESFIINAFTGAVHSENLDAEIQYDIQGKCLSQNQDHKSPTAFMIQGSAKHIFSPTERELNQTAQWQAIPSSFITGIFPISPQVKLKISSLAGPKINVSMRNHFVKGEGPVTIKVDSENLQAYVPLVITERAILLEDMLVATLQINEAINKAFFNEFNPLISGNAYSQHPVLLSVDKQNFLLPIHPYAFEKFAIQSATLDFGKISIANTGTMKDLFQFLDIEEDKQNVESWFTPIFFSISDGTITCKRFDALIDNRIRLAIWGKTNIAKNFVNMTLGIDPEVIKKYFRNTSLKTKNFFLIKIRGPISSPEIDWSSAYARIALLKSYTLGSPFNSLADKLFSSLGDSTPPQTTSPLPWEVTKGKASNIYEANDPRSKVPLRNHKN